MSEFPCPNCGETVRDGMVSCRACRQVIAHPKLKNVSLANTSLRKATGVAPAGDSHIRSESLSTLAEDEDGEEPLIWTPELDAELATESGTATTELSAVAEVRPAPAELDGGPVVRSEPTVSGRKDWILTAMKVIGSPRFLQGTAVAIVVLLAFLIGRTTGPGTVTTTTVATNTVERPDDSADKPQKSPTDVADKVTLTPSAPGMDADANLAVRQDQPAQGSPTEGSAEASTVQVPKTQPPSAVTPANQVAASPPPMVVQAPAAAAPPVPFAVAPPATPVTTNVGAAVAAVTGNNQPAGFTSHGQSGPATTPALLAVYEERRRLVEEKRILDEKKTILESQAKEEQTVLKSNQTSAAQLQSTLNQIQQEANNIRKSLLASRDFGVRLTLQRQLDSLELQYLQQDARLATLKEDITARTGVLTALQPQHETLERKLQELNTKASNLREEWLRVADPLSKWKAGDHKETESLLSEWIALDAEHSAAYVNRAVFCIFASTDLSKARRDVDRAKIIQKDMPAALAVEAFIIHRLGEKNKAADLFTKARLRKSDKWFVLWLQARYQFETGNMLKARADLKASIADNPARVETRIELVELLAGCPDAAVRDAAESIVHATKACEMTNWQRWDALLALATAEAEKGDYPAAVATAGKALALTPVPEFQSVCNARLSLFQAGMPWRIQP